MFTKRNHLDVSDIKLREIELFLNLVKTRSIRELGRQTNLLPGQVSKWIQSLENKLGYSLIERSASGIQPTARALELIPLFEKIQGVQEALAGQLEEQKESQYAFAASSFYSTHLIPLLVREMVTTHAHKDIRIKIIDLAPTHFIPAALRGAFEYCLHSQELDWPQTWTTQEVGALNWNIYARHGHPVAKNSSQKNLLKYPFITPIYWTPDGTRYGDDQCPIPFNKRLKGHETATAASASELIKFTDHLAFLPELVVKSGLLSGEIVEIEAPWRVVRKRLFLSVKNTTVKQSEFELMINGCKKILKNL